MAIDSTAQLLFTINANADDATENIARFRALMGQDLDGMAGQFEDWATEVFGEIETVKGAMIAGTAAIAAAIAAVSVLISEAATEYTKYANDVSAAMKLTGATAEEASTLHEAAAQAGVSFETLTGGLVKFEQSIVKASQGSKPQIKAFEALGISQNEVIAGQKDMIPLLEKVMDGFHNNSSAVQKASLARDLFTRSGTELIGFLSKGAEWLKKMREEADQLHITLTDKDIKSAREFTMTQRALNAEMEGVNTVLGKQTQGLRTWWLTFEATTVKFLTDKKYFGEFRKAWQSTVDEIEASVKSLKTNLVTGDNPPLIDDKPIKEAKQEFSGLATLVEAMKTKIADQGTGWERLAAEVAHYHTEISKAESELGKLRKEGKITPESLAAEQSALAQIPALLAQVISATTEKLKAEDTQRWGEAVTRSAEAQEEEIYNLEKAGEARLQVTREIAGKLAAEEAQGFDQQRAKWIEEQNAWAANLAKKSALTVYDWMDLNKITLDGLTKISTTETEAWQKEEGKLKAHLDSLIAVNQTAQQKLYFDYQKNLQQEQAAEGAALAKIGSDEAKANAIRQMYASIRTQLTTRYQNELQVLLNSQGWQGVFGNYFGQMIRGNQQLFQQWSQSTNQSLLSVQMALEATKELAKKTFDQFAQGLGQTMVQAFVTGKSVSQSMEQMLASTLESFAGQAITAAIMATAWGFLDLALGADAKAAAAFTAAAVFGTVGVAAAIAGKAMTPSSGASSSGAGTGGGSGGGGGAGGSDAAAASASGQTQTGPTVYVTVQGHVIGPSGIAQLTDMINAAVYGNNMTLYASHTKRGVPLG